MQKPITVQIMGPRLLALSLCSVLNEYPDIAAVEAVPSISAKGISGSTEPQVFLLALPHFPPQHVRERRAGYTGRSMLTVAPTRPLPSGLIPRRTALVLTGTVHEISAASAQGFRILLGIDDSLREIYRGVVAAAKCEPYCSPNLTPRLIEALNIKYRPLVDSDQGVVRETLSKREREVADLAAAGMSNAEIAAMLVVSIHTVKCHLRSVYRKLSICRRQHLNSSAAISNLIPKY